METSITFKDAVGMVDKGKLEGTTLTKDDTLYLYAMYKQATSGDVTGDKPGLLNPTARAKHTSRVPFIGMSKKAAKKRYVDFVKTLMK